MADPPKPKRRVTGQMEIGSKDLTSPPGESNGSTVPRVRAKVDPSNIVTSPPLQRNNSSKSSVSASTSISNVGRPTVRSTPSTTSLHSQTSNTTTNTRARSPVPPASNPVRPSSARSASTPRDGRSSPSSSARVEPSPGLTRSGTTPVARVKVGNITRSTTTPSTTITTKFGGSSSPTPTSNRSNTPRIANTNGIAAASAPDLPKLRARVNAISPTTPVHHSPLANETTHITSAQERHLLLTPTGLGPTARHGLALSTLMSPIEVDLSSARSSPAHQHQPLPPPLHPPHRESVASPVFSPLFNHVMHPTASCPPSPIPASSTAIAHGHARAKGRRILPLNPHSQAVPLPTTPLSPELRTIDLPAMTPTISRTSEECSRRTSLTDEEGSEISYHVNERGAYRRSFESQTDGSPIDSGMLLQLARNKLSESTAVPEDLIKGSEEKADDDVIDHTGAEVESSDQGEDFITDIKQAKVDRKIADLEISNASLLNINRTLEATKAKQRTEIIKLRRLLRESLSGTVSTPKSTFGSSNSPLPSALAFLNEEEIDPFDEEIVQDPEIEARWDKIGDVLAAMQRRGEEAVQKGIEEVKLSGGRVLGWMEVEAKNNEDEDADGLGSGLISRDEMNSERDGEDSPAPT